MFVVVVLHQLTLAFAAFGLVVMVAMAMAEPEPEPDTTAVEPLAPAVKVAEPRYSSSSGRGHSSHGK
jgi:hypothetical protein